MEIAFGLLQKLCELLCKRMHTQTHTHTHIQIAKVPTHSFIFLVQ
jgi:hypothetical protein